MDGLDARVLRALSHEWKRANSSLFERRLNEPIFALIDADRRLGTYRSEARTIEINRALISTTPWGVVVDVLLHEMAHQYVAEFLRVFDEPPHGPSFQAVCAERGIDADAAGTPEVKSDEERRLLERVQKLLALAESPNQHEAEAAAAAARKLMIAHNLEMISTREDKRFRSRRVGAPAKRIEEHRRWLARILIDHFFVQGIWVHSYSTELDDWLQTFEISGTTANLDIAEYVHEFVEATALRLWEEFRRTHGGRRNQYLAGVVRGFHAKLGEQELADPAARALIKRGDVALAEYYERRHPERRMISRQGQRRTGAYGAGLAAGRSIVLSKGVGGSSVSRGHLLPGPRRRS